MNTPDIGMWADQTGATQMAISGGAIPPPRELAYFLLDFLRVAGVLDYDLGNYIPQEPAATLYALPGQTDTRQ